MIGRRTFFRELATIATGVLVAPNVLCAKSDDRFKWKRSIQSDIWVPNPEYFNAKYEICFLAVNPINPIIFKRDSNLRDNYKLIDDPYPIRFNDSIEHIIHPFKKLE